MLQHFTSYGMDDLQFMIVNSKRSASMSKLHHLKRRVTFDVYQETEEEPVWNILEGGKDDIYIYDRCGKLAYYVPFPLSIIHGKQPIVVNAVRAAYFISPCGPCEVPETPTRDDSINELNHINDRYTPEDTGTTSTAENYSQDANTTLMETENNTSTEQYPTNETSVIDLSDYYVDDYPDYVQDNITSNNSSSSSYNTTEDAYTISDNEDLSNDTNTTTELTTNSNYTDDTNSTTPPKNDTETREHSDRCIDVDERICENYSKRKLLQMRRCCDAISAGGRPCMNFGRRRCKKVQTILKCCLRTGLTKESTTVTNSDEIVCCKDTEDGKLCHVAESPECDSDEYVLQTEVSSK